MAVSANSGSELWRYSKAEYEIHRSGSTDDPDGATVTSMQARKTGRTVYLGLSNGTVHIYDEGNKKVVRIEVFFQDQFSIDIICLFTSVMGESHLYLANKKSGNRMMVLLHGTDLVLRQEVKTYESYQGSSLFDMRNVEVNGQLCLAMIYEKGGIL